MKKIALILFFLPFVLLAQEPTFEKGIPNDLADEKIIFLEHESINITADTKKGAEGKYLYRRQLNHNKVIEEANTKLRAAALSYPHGYAIASPSTYPSLQKAGYKYVLISNVYKYEYLTGQPEEGDLTVFPYYIFDAENNIAYEVFELDEMKIYDFRLIMKS